MLSAPLIHNKSVAVYKVPQDVEADDKLIGPFSFRQFIYLIVVAIAGFVAFLLGQIFVPLIIIPLPIIILFGALALPLRKDQPMETYLLAVVRFYLKPKRRMWDPEGTPSHIEITAPATIEHALTKDFNQEVAQQRLDYLARIMDSRGWSLKGVSKETASVNAGVAAEAANAFDIMDDHADLAKSFDTLLAKKNQENRQALVQRMKQGPAAPQPRAAAPTQQPPAQAAHPNFANNPYDDVLEKQFAQSQPKPEWEREVSSSDDVHYQTPEFNPYPNAMHQKVVSPYHVPNNTNQPMQPVPKKEEPKPVQKPLTQTVSPDIMRLASNNDLSISAIANEAHRLQGGDEGEVVIKLH